MTPAGQGEPYYKLSSFQHVIRNLPLDQLKIAVGSATARVMTLRRCSEDKAREYIRTVVLGLGKGHFAKTIVLDGGMPADEYGMVVDNVPLYVKLGTNPKGPITPANHYIVSCHPTMHALRTLNGIVPQYVG